MQIYFKQSFTSFFAIPDCSIIVTNYSNLLSEKILLCIMI